MQGRASWDCTGIVQRLIMGCLGKEPKVGIKVVWGRKGVGKQRDSGIQWQWLIQTVLVYRGKCSLWWTLVLGTSVIQTRPRAPMSAHPRLLLTYSLEDVFGDRRQGLKIWSALSIHIYTASTLWGGLTHQCMHSIYSIQQSVRHGRCFSLPFGKGKTFWFTAFKCQGEVVLALLRNRMSS